MSRNVIAACLLALCIGCSGPSADAPKTHPVIGTVLGPDGQPWQKGLVEFHSASQADLTINAVIEGGKFSLRTVAGLGDTPVDGVPEGNYTATITPDIGATQAGAENLVPIKVPGAFTVKPGENSFTLKVPPRKS